MLLHSAIVLAVFQASFSAKPKSGPPCGQKCGGRSNGVRWVYCNEEWKEVNEETCEGVFKDEKLKVCQANQDFFKKFPGADVYLWNPAGNPQYYHCAHLPTECFCPACSSDGSVTITTTTTTTPETATPSSCKCGMRKKNSAVRRGRRLQGKERCFKDKETGNNKCRIVGGTQAVSNEFPWQVGIKMNGGKHPFCGGSILSKRTILTAHHCTEYLSVSSMKVVVGDHDTKNADGEIEYAVESKLEYSKVFDKSTFANDFAILYLEKDLVFGDNVAPVCLPSKENDDAYDNVVATVTGWGTTYEDGPVEQILQKVDVETMTNEVCYDKYKIGTKWKIQDNMICAARNGKDACQGDSGGPLITKETGSEDYYSLIGIVSWGEGCARPEYPGVYARVTKALQWIKDNMKGETCDAP